jgi:hypothetical protein
VIQCSLKNAAGEQCVLDQWHDASYGWKYRVHKTAEGRTFTYMVERDKARPGRGLFPR